MREASLERHKDFPDVWFALLILAQLLGIEVLLVDGFYDAGARFSRGDPRFVIAGQPLLPGGELCLFGPQESTDLFSVGDSQQNIILIT